MVKEHKSKNDDKEKEMMKKQAQIDMYAEDSHSKEHMKKKMNSKTQEKEKKQKKNYKH